MPEITRLEGRRAFGRDPARYHESRPDYPERVFDILRERCSLMPGLRILEIGPGTGRVTRRLLAMGAARLAAVEPDERLCAFLAEACREWIPRPLEIRAAPFEEADLEEGSFDLGVAATSFHWLEAETALPRILRLLRPGGWWSAFWDVYADPFSPDPFREATRALFERVPRTPSYGGDERLPYALETDLREGELRASGFADVGSETFRRTVTMDGTSLRSLYATFSQFALMPEDRRWSVLGEIGRIAREDFGDRVERTFTTAVYWGRRPERRGASGGISAGRLKGGDDGGDGEARRGSGARGVGARKEGEGSVPALEVPSCPSGGSSSGGETRAVISFRQRRTREGPEGRTERMSRAGRPPGCPAGTDAAGAPNGRGGRGPRTAGCPDEAERLR